MERNYRMRMLFLATDYVVNYFLSMDDETNYKSGGHSDTLKKASS